MKLCKMSIKDLRKILIGLERIALSPFQIRALCSGRQREANQESMAEIVEFCICVGLTTTISADDWDGFDNMVKHFQSLNVMRGRRARELELPTDWNITGVYHKRMIRGKVAIVNRFSKFWIVMV